MLGSRIPILIPAHVRRAGQRLFFGDHSPAERRWNLCAETILVALLLFMPLALGGVEPWAELVAEAGVAVLAGLLAVRSVFQRHQRFVWSWTYIPVALFLALVVLQVVELPAGWIEKVAPGTLALKNELLAGNPTGAGGNDSTSILSFYPGATGRSLRALLLPVALFIITMNLIRSREQVKRLLVAVTVIGAVVSMLALAQVVTRAEEVYWSIPTTFPGVVTGGPFINHSDFAQFANLCLGATLALLLVLLRQSDELDDRSSPLMLIRRMGSSGSVAIWLLAIVIVLDVVAIVAAQSRGGALALLVALTLTMTFLAIFGGARGRGPVIAAVVTVAIGAAIYFGLDALYERFASGEPERPRMLRDMLTLVPRFPIFGTGLGTFQFVFPTVDTSTQGLVATHAENEYAQVLIETGFVGLALVVIFAGGIAVHFFKNIRSSLPTSSAAYGIGFGLIAAAVQSFSGFGQHLPAIAGLSAVFCGLMVSLTRLQRPRGVGEQQLVDHDATVAPRWRMQRVLNAVTGLVVLGGLSAALAWGLPEVEKTREAAIHWQQATALEQALASDGWQGMEADYKGLIDQAEAAVALQPTDVTYRYGLSAFRWRAIERFYEPNSEPYAAYARRIIDELLRNQYLCPTYGPPLSLAGQLESFVLDEKGGPDHIRKGYLLTPTDAATCFAAGKLDVREGRWQDSLVALRRAIRTDSNLLRAASDLYLVIGSRPDLAIALVESDPNELQRVADDLEGQKDDDSIPPAERARLVKSARDKAFTLLADRSKGPHPTAGDLAAYAEMLNKRRDYAAAVDQYRRALAMNFGQSDWRMQLAKTLVAAGRVDEARQEATICLRQRPGWEEARQLAEASPKQP